MGAKGATKSLSFIERIPRKKPAFCPSERIPHSRFGCRNNYASACEGAGVRLGGWTDENGHQHGQNNHVR